MKVPCLSLLLVLLSLSSLTAKDKHLFVLSGQSNMAGLDPAVSFIPAVEKAFGKDGVIVVKDAQGGQPIRRWDPKWKPAKGDGPPAPGDLYERLMTKVKKAVAGQSIATVTFIWMQGERDAKEQHGEVYRASLRRLIDQVGEDLGQEKVRFVIGRLSDFDMEDKRHPHWPMVRDEQVALAESDPLGAWVDTDDLNDKNGKDDLHYTRDGYKELGQRFADKAIALVKGS